MSACISSDLKDQIEKCHLTYMDSKTKKEKELETWAEENPSTAKAYAGMLYCLVVTCWVFGLCSPLIILPYSWYKGSYTVFAIYCSIVAHPYLTKPKKVESLCTFARVFMGRWFADHSLTFESLPSVGNKALYCVQPHGIFCVGWGFIPPLSLFKDVRFLIASGLHHAPFFRSLCHYYGNYGSASKNDMLSFMRKGENLAFIAGGFEEATIFKYGEDRLFIKNRAGFVYYALKFGYKLVPVYCFGESETYYNVQGALNFRLGLNKRQLPAVAPFGWKYFPLLPRPEARMHVVVGSELVLPTIDQPTKEDVAKYHDIYMKEVEALYNRHKGTFGVDRNLIIM